jgi:hypothetical protein
MASVMPDSLSDGAVFIRLADYDGYALAAPVLAH